MRIGIIGGGAAGMMAAATLAQSPKKSEVFLIEKNPGLGRKVIISGGGRCNVTTGRTDLRAVLDCYPRGSKFLTSAFQAFPPEKVIDWFQAAGVPLHIEEDLRVFPNSNDGRDVVRAFQSILQKIGVQVLLSRSVERIEKSKSGFTIHMKDRGPLEVDRLILTTGGQAYRHTGSTGEGYAFAEALGHRITPLAPSLNSFISKENWPQKLSGVSFTQATLTAKREKRVHFTGPFLFTHKGLSGPAVFALSSLVAFEHYDKEHPLNVTIDLLPELPHVEFEAEFIRARDLHPKKDFVNFMAAWMPKSVAQVLCGQLQIPDHKNVVEVSKKDVTRALEWVKHVPLSIVGRGAGDEFVTAGGVPLKEVDSKTMESKVCPGLYFAGEILDIDGFTGGYNLQASWATGRRAGESIVAQLS